VLCRVLRVSRAGYDAWAGRGASARAQADERLAAQVAAAYAGSRSTDGVPRVHAARRAAGVRSSRRRVARLMRAAGRAGRCRRRRARTTASDPTPAPAPDLVARDVTATGPERLWRGDSTYLPTREGGRSLAVPLDACSRRVIGRALADHRRTARALAAPTMALRGRRPAPGLVHHTDRGCQDTAAAYQQALAARGVSCSLRRAGACRDNALAERCCATLQAERVGAAPWPTRAAARTAAFAWLASCYNRQRSHAALAYQPPVTFEANMLLLCQPATSSSTVRRSEVTSATEQCEPPVVHRLGVPGGFRQEPLEPLRGRGLRPEDRLGPRQSSQRLVALARQQQAVQVLPEGPALRHAGELVVELGGVAFQQAGGGRAGYTAGHGYHLLRAPSAYRIPFQQTTD